MTVKSKKSSASSAAAAAGQIVNQTGLRWKKVARPSQSQAAALDQEGAILGLEEVEGVEVVYEELPGGGKKVVFRTLDPLLPGETLDSGSEDGMYGLDEDEMEDDGAFDDEEPWGGIQSDGEARVEESKPEPVEVATDAVEEDATPSAEEGEPKEEAVVLTAKERKARERKAKLALEKAERKKKQAEEGPKLPQLTPLPNSFDDARLPAWRSIKGLHPAVKHSLLSTSFMRPSPIQAAALPSALAGRDVVGVAQTGSGKTLAYGLPIIDYILRQPAPAPSKNPAKRKLQALILAPTRELALQVSQHLQKCAEGCVEVPFTETVEEAEVVADAGASDEDEGETAAEKGLKERLEENPWAKPGRNGRFKKKAKKEVPIPKTTPPKAKPTGPKPPPRVSVGSIVGGMSVDKQTRILKRGVDILVATPGRLWDLIGEDESIAQSIREMKFLVIDEADRMIEAGHFQELESIVSLTHRATTDAPPPTPKVAPVEDLKATGKANPNSEAADKPFQQKAEGLEGRADLQTFVFSATMEKELQKNLKRFKGNRMGGGKKKDRTTLDDLFEKLDFRDEEPEVIDLSTEGGVVATLQESQVNCLAEEKDLYLYYFLLRYPGRSIVFFGSIDGIRRAVPLLELLKLPIFPLHSDLQQKQRLKNLDRFKSTPNAILLATDIAARGLDIPSVDHVVHYQLPRSADVYVHRSGRTARAMKDGFSLQLCGPEEKKLQKLLMKSFGRTEDIPELPAERSLLEQLRRRISLAREVETANHKMKKKNHEKNWLKEAAEAMDIELDSEPSDDDELPMTKRNSAGSAKYDPKIAKAKAELNSLLKQPIMVRGISHRYITSGSRRVVDDIIAGNQHATMLGVANTTAAGDAIANKKRKAAEQEDA